MKWVKTILSSFLAIQVLFVSMGFTINQHYCMDRLMDTAFNTHAESCMGMEMGDLEMEMECCEDTSNDVETDDTFLTKVQDNPQPVFALVEVILWEISNESLVTNNPVTNNYTRPPPLIRDIPILVQSFRI